jgi:hypothetical protein
MFTVLPHSVTVRKTEKEFRLLSCMVRKARELLNAKTTLSTPKPRSLKTPKLIQ